MGILAAAGLLALLLAACGTTQTGTSPSVAPAAQKLADDDAGHPLPSNDPSVRAIARHLKSLDRKCRGSDITVAASVDFGSTDLAKHGIQRSRRQLIADLDKNVQGFAPNFDCAGFLVADLVVEETGK